MDINKIISKLLPEITAAACKPNALPFYSLYVLRFTEYLKNVECTVEGHFCNDDFGGDVVGTCSCHYRLYTWPHKLLKNYLYECYIESICRTEW